MTTKTELERQLGRSLRSDFDVVDDVESVLVAVGNGLEHGDCRDAQSSH